MGKRAFLIFLILAITVRLNMVVLGAKRPTTPSTRINQFWQINDRRLENQNRQDRRKLDTGTNNMGLQRPVSFVKEKIQVKNQKIDKTEPIGQRGNSLLSPSKLRSRESRLLNLFTLVRFDNNVCFGASGENGTCMSGLECGQRGGISTGVCANGYGICCIVTATCGQTTFDNNTYFVNSNYPGSFDGTESCQLTLLKSHPDICQFRLDFVQFNIRGPETYNNLCTYDQFIVSGGNPVPPICGNNNGNHMYIDIGTGQTNPVTLSFVTSGSGFDRSWRVRIAQIPCSSIYRAEEGCLQYFTGVSGTIRSFNYDPITGLQLSNQDYSICIRMERNFCGIQYMTCPEGADQTYPVTIPSSVVGQTRNSGFTLTGNTLNGQYSATFGQACQTDWLLIPCAMNSGRLPGTQLTCPDRVCGGVFNTESSINSTSIISTVKPFRLVFHTDGSEAPSDYGNRGFCLNYIQQPCTMKLR